MYVRGRNAALISTGWCCDMWGRGAPEVEAGPSADNVYDDASGWYWITDRRGAGTHPTQRSRNRPKGTVRTTCWHLGAFHASLSANQGRTPGRSSNCRGHPCCTPRIRHRSRGTAQTTFWHVGALHVSLAGNRDRTSVNGSLSPLGNLSCNSGARTTSKLPPSGPQASRDSGSNGYDWHS
jgi:hypothetical protein